MPRNNVIPIDHKKLVKSRLVSAVGPVLAQNGFVHLDEALVAQEAGVHKSNITRFFGGMPGLMSAFGESGVFWPTVEELMQETPRDFPVLLPEQQVAAFFKSMLACLRRRPVSLDILAWAALERNELTRRLEDVQVRTALEYFEHLHGEISDDIDLSAIVALLAGAVHFLAIRSRNSRTFGGIDLESDAGWRRIEKAIEVLMHGSLSDEQK